MKKGLLILAAAALVGTVGGYLASGKNWHEVKVREDQFRRVNDQVKKAERSRMDLKRSNAVQERNQAAEILRYSRAAQESKAKEEE